MIRSLQDAWKWYRAVRTLSLDMKHLAGRCDRPEWEAVLNLDNRLRHRTAAELHDLADTILDDLNDLAVLVLFSVFEATVRARAGEDVDRETALISHVAVRQAVKRPINTRPMRSGKGQPESTPAASATRARAVGQGQRPCLAVIAPMPRRSRLLPFPG